MLRVTRFGRGGGGFRVVVVMLFHVGLGLVGVIDPLLSLTRTGTEYYI
jgi:hypothetical protein